MGIFNSRIFLKQAFYKILKYGQWHEFMIHKIKKNSHALILNFHKISPEQHPYYPGVCPEVFSEFVDSLLPRFNITNFSKLINYEDTTKPLVVFSFDDGYSDFLKYAVPIFRKRGLSANQNIIVQSVVSGLPPWNICMYDWFQNEGPSLVQKLIVPGMNTKIKTSQAIGKYLKQLPRAEREDIISRIIPKFDPNKIFNLTPMMNISNIKSIQSDFDIGCHSYSHESMGYQEPQFFEEDYNKSLDFFQNQLQQPLDIYAFPNGSFRQENLDFLNSKKIKHILLVEEKYANFKSNIHPRFTMYGESVNELYYRALGFHGTAGS